MTYRYNIIFLLTIFLFFQLIISCGEGENQLAKPITKTQKGETEQPGKSITLTQSETLAYLVRQADLIAIVQIMGGTDKKRIISFAEMPKQVDAEIVSIIKGVENRKSIRLGNSPMFYPPGVIKISVLLRNGRFLAFLNREGDSYKPTTRFSLFEVFNNKVHPIWKQGKDSNEISAGYALEVIVNEIENEMNK